MLGVRFICSRKRWESKLTYMITIQVFSHFRCEHTIVARLTTVQCLIWYGYLYSLIVCRAYIYMCLGVFLYCSHLISCAVSARRTETGGELRPAENWDCYTGLKGIFRKSPIVFFFYLAVWREYVCTSDIAVVYRSIWTFNVYTQSNKLKKLRLFIG